MAGILGEPFDKGVIDQINIRQQKLGAYVIPSSTIEAYQSRTAFIRLASAVNIDGKDDSAKNLVLLGGVSGYSTKLKFGLGAYSVYIGERSNAPMPSIVSANVGYYNRGALAKADIKIKVYTKEQLEIIDKLYCRPGYTILLEWGWTKYLDNSGNLKNIDANINSVLEKLFQSSNQYQIGSAIRKTRANTNYNYDGFYGKISKFSWNFNADGSYDISINAIGLGDIIESLKINVSPPNKNQQTEKDKKDPNQLLVISNKEKSSLNKKLWEIYNDTAKYENGKLIDYNTDIYDIDSDGKVTQTSGKISEAIYFIKDPSFKTTEKSSPQVYIKFGLLCNLLQLYSMFKDEKGVPYVAFDFNFKDLNQDTTYGLAFPGEFSADPTVCLVPPTQNTITKKLYSNPNDVSLDFIKQTNNILKFNNSVIKVANIYVNIEFIVSVLDSLVTQNEKDSSVILLDFLKAILNGIAKALGGFNQFEVYTDEITNKIIIRDNNPINDSSLQTKQTGKFKAYGVVKNQGSFLTNINLSAELSNNFATQITIGAQVNGNQPTANSSGLTAWNNGLTDRIINEKVSPTYADPIKPTETPEQKITELSKNIVDTIKLLPDRDTIDSLVSTNSEYASLSLGFYSNAGNFPAPGLFPLNLSLEMDGLSGMINYQKFEITNEVLPKQYEDNVDFIIKGITHDISDNKWTTKIESIMSPKIKKVSKTQQQAAIQATQTQVQTATAQQQQQQNQAIINNSINQSLSQGVSQASSTSTPPPVIVPLKTK